MFVSKVGHQLGPNGSPPLILTRKVCLNQDCLAYQTKVLIIPQKMFYKIVQKTI
jgi:hypothetical protein